METKNPGPPFRARALLLVGPTGSGKTPLGEALERSGLAGRRCLHFDFGVRLRAAALDPASTPGLTPSHADVIRRALETGALLEDADFPIALRLLASFLESRRAAPGDILVLNGMPRHAGQARDIAAAAEIRAVAALEAGAAVVAERIRTDAGSDRSGREDDSPDEIERRLRLYAERTAPLVSYYAERGVPVVAIPVGPADKADDLAAKLLAALDAAKVAWT